MRLSDSAIRSAKPTEKPFGLNDTGGLYVGLACGRQALAAQVPHCGKFRALSRCLLATLTTHSAVGIVANMKAELITLSTFLHGIIGAPAFLRSRFSDNLI